MNENSFTDDLIARGQWQETHDYPIEDLQLLCWSNPVHVEPAPRPTSITIRPAQDPDHLLSKGLSAGWVLLLKVLLIVVLFYAGLQVCSHVVFTAIPGVK